MTALVTPMTCCDRGIARHHGRVHPLLDLGLGPHRHTQKLDAIAEVGSGIEVGKRDRRNAFDIDRARVELSCRTPDLQGWKALRGVVPFDIEGWIGLCVPKPLRFAQAVVKRQTVLLHAREDVIAGAVEDTVDAREGVAVQSFAQRLDNRNATADRRLEIQRNVVPPARAASFCP